MTLLPLPVPVPAGPDALSILPVLEDALTGRAPVMPYAADGPPPLVAPHDPADLPEGLAVAVGTSGSTGRPKWVLLTAEALGASADATHDVIGGSGSWLLALPAHHVAGLQVLVRSLRAGTTPLVLDSRDGFTAAGFARAAARLEATGASRRYTALVPTQLGRLLAAQDGLDALLGFDGVLVGGSATPQAMHREALEAGVPLRLTYGMSETAGGCVYDGVPLPTSQIHIDNDRHVVLGGATVAHGYLGEPGLTADAFSTDPEGVRWFRTDDLGRFDERERLVIDGRADDVINTGGLKITPGVVEDAIARHVPDVLDAIVIGMPDGEWGEEVCAAVTLLDPNAHVTARDVRDQLRGILPDPALPRRVVTLPTIPHLAPGKPDRAAIRLALQGD
ncbi:MAG: o-succinylbenzoate--CoA ligase [Intrasporangium sp.]|uniref:o-succinylbenzoate--CoA ligase n=1 Tax=Intrasporangium sp. TaxID=1925024 RepID=UPI002649EF7E|nr:o-succinylbenzoate--CoA ligase [Intrasporangium sp.]MDN5797826.1 o-succinylbenzoate--CoA ligase [Intrasporangium sp.]